MKRGPENQLSSSYDKKKAKSAVNLDLSYLTLAWNYLFGTASASDACFKDEDHPLLDKSKASPLVSNDSNLKQAYHHVMFNYLDNKSLVRFASTCKQSRILYGPAAGARALANLMEAVALGNQDLAERILEARPNLLEMTAGTAKEYSGKIIKGITPFQAALCADDVDMAEMMKTFFSKLECGQAKMEVQFNVIFPEGIEAHREAQEKAAFDFSEIMQAIIDAPIDEVRQALKKQFDNNLKLHKALDDFRKRFAQVTHDEQAFNIYHFLKAFTQYDAFYDRTDSWKRRDLILRQVVGWTQRFFSACWAQATAQGVALFYDKNNKLRRSFKFPDYEASIFFPLIDKVGCGYDYACSTVGSIAIPRGGGTDWVASRRSDFKNLSLAKTTDFTKLISDRNSAQKWCVIC